MTARPQSFYDSLTPEQRQMIDAIRKEFHLDQHARNLYRLLKLLEIANKGLERIRNANRE